jgi:hypothetical protein
MAPMIDVRAVCRQTLDRALEDCKHGMTEDCDCIAEQYTNLVAPLIEALELYARDPLNYNARAALAEFEKAGTPPVKK